MSASDIRFYVDTLIVETILGNPSLIKKADSKEEAESGVINTVKNYVEAHIDKNDKIGSLLNILAPAALAALGSFLGLPKWGILAGLAISTFHIDINSMIEPLLKTVKDSLTSGKMVTESQIDAAVNETVQQHTSADSDEASDDVLNNSVAQVLQEARLFRLATQHYEQHILRLTKEVSPTSSFLVSYAATRAAQTTSLFGRLLGWAFKTALISAGFMVAGDFAAKMMGMPSALTPGSYQAGKTSPADSTSAPASPVATQKKYPLISGQNAPHPQPWVENVTNDPGSIENMLVDFTKQVYSGLDGHEGDIHASPTFQAVKSQIAWYNQSAAGRPGVYIPKNYPSKQAIVDHYIDEVAKASS